MEKKPNRAVERTKKWIFQALISLLDEKPYTEIGISDITDRAGVTRPSFYRNYASKEDIIIQGLDAIFNEVILKVKEIGQTKTSKVFEIYFTTLLEHRDILEKLVKNNLLLFLDPFTKKHEAIIVEAYKGTLTHEENQRFQYVVKFQFGGLHRIVQFWVQSGFLLSPEEMSVLVYEFLSPFKKKKQSIMDLLLMIEG